MDAVALPLAEIAARIRHALHNNVIEIGDLLLQAKAQLDHGQFQTWAESELGIRPRSAQNYMNAAAFVKDKSETVALLPPAILYKISAPSAPKEIVEKVVNAETIDVSAIETELADYRDRKRIIEATTRKKSRKPSRQSNDRQLAKLRREEAQAKAAEATRQDEIRPLIDRLTASGLVEELFRILEDWRLYGTFKDMLREAR